MSLSYQMFRGIIFVRLPMIRDYGTSRLCDFLWKCITAPPLTSASPVSANTNLIHNPESTEV
jgi:hypothetical protein